VKDVLTGMLPSVSLSMDAFKHDYDRAAEEFLNRQDATALLPRCSALFIDEAQDMGPSTLRLLLSLVEQTDAEDPNSRSAHIFYDNAQNIYGRKTPRWSEFGLDMRGRSTIMRESFRSTTPIAELAVNVLHRLSPAVQRQDQNELMEMGLIEKGERNGKEWLRVRFSQIDGPKPIFHSYNSRSAEIEVLTSHLKHLIQKEGISPNDICVIYNGKSIVERLEADLGPKLAEIGVELSVQTNRPFERQKNTLVITTSHSYKGYESEVLLIPCVDQFVTAEGQILANNLYVAMTRARSLLAIYGMSGGSAASRKLIDTISSCVETMNSTPDVEVQLSSQDDFNDILEVIGIQHRKWLADLWRRFEIHQEPITDADGRVLAEPLFWFENGGVQMACFGSEGMSHDHLKQLGESRFIILKAGEGPPIGDQM
jgi:superfamily I DNA/RNA helicase